VKDNIMTIRINFTRFAIAALAAALGAALLAGCGGSGEAAGPAPKLAAGAANSPDQPAEGALLPYTKVGSDYTAVPSRNFVIRDNAAWAAFWTADQAGFGTPAPRPQIDFVSQMVVGVYGPSDSCAQLNIVGVKVKAKRLTVEYAITPPGPNVQCVAYLGYPRQLLVIDKQDLPLVFVNTGSGEVEASFQTIAASSYTGVTQAKNVVARDAASWAALWTDYIGNPPPNATVLARPDVDFSKYMVVGVFNGYPSSACQSIAVQRVDDRAGQLQVSYTVTVPGPATMCLAAVISPGQLVLVPYSDGAVQFVASEVKI
jgi:hypothetical protein